MDRRGSRKKDTWPWTMDLRKQNVWMLYAVASAGGKLEKLCH